MRPKINKAGTNKKGLPLRSTARQSCSKKVSSEKLPQCAHNDRHLIKNQQGISIVTAIFLITVLALLATAAVQLVSTGQQSLSQEITSIKAYFAAQTGLQWGMYQAVYATPSGTQTLTLSASGLGNTAVDVSFFAKNIGSKTYYQMTATGSYSSTASPEYSVRQLQLRFKP